MSLPDPGPNAMNAKEREVLIRSLRTRFERNMPRHPGATWSGVEERLQGRPEALVSLEAMERTAASRM